MLKAKVIDAIMGQGKTTWAIQYMIDNPDKKFIFVTPFLDEVTRVKKAVPNMYEPFTRNNNGGGKLNSLKDLTLLGKNIVTTHSLMARFDKEVLYNIKVGEYILILDEVTDVIEQFNFSTKDNRNIFFKTVGHLDGDRYLCWNKEGEFNPDEFEKESFFSDLMPMCLNRQLVEIGTDVKSYIKEFPVSIFQSFSEVYILTYMFEGSIQKPYFELKGIEYELLGLENGKIVPYEPTSQKIKQELKELINITEKESLNSIGDNYYAFSSSWCKKNLIKGSVFSVTCKNNTKNFIRNINKGNAEDSMVGTFKGEDKQEYFDLVKDKGYSTKSLVFVPFNKKATNEYAHKRILVYLVNIFPHTALKMYFTERGGQEIQIDDDAYALSILIQWIWRSRIRNQSLPKSEREIQLYIPSRRMREILIKWLDS